MFLTALLSLASCCLQRRSWHEYSKRLAKIAVGVSRWVQRLRQYAVQPTEGLVLGANRSLEVRIEAECCIGSVACKPSLPRPCLHSKWH